MAAPIDPTTRRSIRTRVSALQAPDLCGWCLGAGKYLEALDWDVVGAYLPVVCENCAGAGHLPRE
jgi:hypothetical protein